MARRLIESGVTFVAVEDFEHVEWDLHGLGGGNQTVEAGTRLKGPHLDNALSALVDDLNDRGLLDTTLVVAMGEFGRTPRVNPMPAGITTRAYTRCCSLAEGCDTGRLSGRARRAAKPLTAPCVPAMCWRPCITSSESTRGLPPADNTGRPIPLLAEGEAIRELVGAAPWATR